MAGHLIKTPSGHLLLNSDGHLTVKCCCGCCPGGVPCCTACVADTPCRWLLTIAGSALNGGCIVDPSGSGNFLKWDAAASFDGSYCLLKFDDGSVNNCTWSASATATLYVYSDGACTTLIDTVTNWTIHVHYSPGAFVQFDAVEIFDASGRFVIQAPMFNYGTPSDSCADPFSDVPSGGVLASTGGTWTLTPNAC